MNIKKTIIRIATLFVVGIPFTSCEDDFETIGSDIIGAPGFSANLYEDAVITTRTNALAPVQTNNLPLYLLGVYDDPVFNTQTASILTQLDLSVPDPSFGKEPVLDSVVMYIPYLSRKIDTEDGEEVYELDSIYGSAPIRLAIYETDYFLNQFDPETGFEQTQKYYSDLGGEIADNLTSNLLYLEESFVPTADEIIEFSVDEQGNKDTVALAPGIRFKLSTEFFQDKIIEAEGSTALSDRSAFYNYLRSIYIQAEKTGDEGNMMLLNLSGEHAGVSLYYTVEVADTEDVDEDGDESELVREERSYKLNFGPTKVNTFEQEVPTVTGAENIYLKGGEGAMGIIELFSGPDADADGVSDELEFLRENEWLINEAHLEFFVNREFVNGINQPERLYIYDLKNNIMLDDYVLETPGRMNPMASLANQDHLGALQKDEQGRGISYKINITQHVNNLINKDSTNVPLGLVVSQNVNLLTNSAVKQTENSDIERIPASAVITPEATVLYGPDAVDDEKRLKLKIYYTEPKE